MSEQSSHFSAERPVALIWSQLSAERRRQVMLILVQLACKLVAIPVKPTDQEVHHAVTHASS